MLVSNQYIWFSTIPKEFFQRYFSVIDQVELFDCKGFKWLFHNGLKKLKIRFLTYLFYNDISRMNTNCVSKR